MDDVCEICKMNDYEANYSQCIHCKIIYCEPCEVKHEWIHYGYGFYCCHNCKDNKYFKNLKK